MASRSHGQKGKRRTRAILVLSLCLAAATQNLKLTGSFVKTITRLLRNPEQWIDHRAAKAQHLREPRHPDFTNSELGKAIWMSTLKPEKLLELKAIPESAFRVDDLKSTIATTIQTTRRTTATAKPTTRRKTTTAEVKVSDAALWESLFEDPDKWLDCRTVKQDPRDFIREADNQGLYLKSAPKDIIAKLTSKGSTGLWQKLVDDSHAGDGSHDAGSAWQSLVKHPKEWTDYRQEKESGKVSRRFPDFKHEGGVVSLWLEAESTPSWVHEQFPPLETSGRLQRPKKSDFGREQLWQSLFEDAQGWEDFRARKQSGALSPRFPDFKHVSNEGLWLDSPTTPGWVLEQLAPLDA
eukprot:TRINITY_DN7548_c0_g1_i2.p1 TRINITY_DN7548_c0_g1~~TRINITY_DN7548_c0_g1_i2.p1  ORF type:complete len:352 (+),score=36.17 TRINITY_DN7548_c0_g1_i2:70-1125(+)